MVALDAMCGDPTRGDPTRTGFPPSAPPELHEPKLRRHLAAVALSIVGGFVVGICIANPGAAIIRDSLITLIAVEVVVLTKRSARSARSTRAPLYRRVSDRHV